MKYLFIFLLLVLNSCARDQQSWRKNSMSSDREFSIKMYSGGILVFEDHFKGMINQDSGEHNSYYFKGDTLIEISGDYVLKSVK